MIMSIDHVGIAVRSIDERLALWTEALGLPHRGTDAVPSEQVRVAFLDAGGARIELLEPAGETSPVGRFLEQRGEGIHHLTLAVRELDGALERLAAHGVTVLGGGPRPGAHGTRVAFLHPRSTGGVLLELVESRGQAPAGQELGPGAAVLVYLRDPQEKLWGVLRRLDAGGAVVEAIDLGSFDDWVAQVEHGDESVVGPSLAFLPMTRVERIVLDRSSGHLPSLAERFQRRTGRSVQEVLGESR
jgi:methylmalonyl-CoA/ethylmalonyl-CoA epimerase